MTSGHDQDLKDVNSMFRAGLIEKDKLNELFEMIQSNLYRYPAISAEHFRQSLEDILSKRKEAE